MKLGGHCIIQRHEVNLCLSWVASQFAHESLVAVEQEIQKETLPSAVSALWGSSSTGSPLENRQGNIFRVIVRLGRLAGAH